MPNIADLARETFGQAVRQYRSSNGWTQAELAQKLVEYGLSATQTTIAKIERGDRPTPISEAAVLAAIFGIPVQSLLPMDRASATLHQLGILMTSFNSSLDRHDKLLGQLDSVDRHIMHLLRDWDRAVSDIVEDEVDALRSYDIDARKTSENGMLNRAKAAGVVLEEESDGE